MIINLLHKWKGDKKENEFFKKFFISRKDFQIFKEIKNEISM